MKLSSGVPQRVDQRLLDVHVDVFELDPEWQFLSIKLAFDHPKLIDDFAKFLFGQHPLLAQHRRVRDRTTDIMPIKPMVKRNALAELRKSLIHLTRKNAASG
jgi:hypothetical protein